MRLTIISVGRIKAGPEHDLLTTYSDRFGATGRNLGLGELTQIELDESRAPTVDKRRADEAGRIGGRRGSGHILVALDETGRDTSSTDLADWLRETRDSGVPGIDFVIGGPDGLDRDFAREADRRIAFGRATWPHRLVRVMLAEQLYRTATILAGHPYHRT